MFYKMYSLLHLLFLIGYYNYITSTSSYVSEVK